MSKSERAGQAHWNATIPRYGLTSNGAEQRTDLAPLVEARGLTKDYPCDGGVTRVVDDVSFAIPPGETLGLVGESGSGKSTVARMLLRLIEPTGGEVLFEGQPLPPASSAADARPAPPHADRLPGPLRRTEPAHARPPDPAGAVQIHREPPPEGTHARLRELLHSVGLDESALMRYPHEFSGGQRQRINIARALALRPRFLVLDEPVSALDVSVGAQVINLLRDLQRSLG